MDRIKLLCDINELNHLFRDSVSIEHILQRMVDLVTHHIKSDVCSIWLYDDDSKFLTLRATKGLSKEGVNHLTMKLGEGLAGTALKELRPISTTKASSHPDYKIFIGTGEEEFDNFLVVPIARGITRIGVLVLRRKKRKRFSKEDVLACKAVGSQLANIIENARFLMAMHTPQDGSSAQESIKDSVFVRGKVASEGYAFSVSKVVDKKKTFESLLRMQIEETYSKDDFNKAVKDTELQLEEMQQRVEEKLSDAASLIFTSHLMILKDKEFIGTMSKLIDEGKNPPEAILQVAKNYVDIFSGSTHPYVREKVQDVEDLVVRMVSNILGESRDIARYGNRVVIARDLFPSDLLRMSSEQVSGIVLVTGGITSHLSILSRSLQIPMVIANDLKLLSLPNKTPIIVDAEAGNVYINPSEEIISNFEKRNAERKSIQLSKLDIKPATLTRDGAKINLFANINLISDIGMAQDMHCGGVGLYRTEFPFIIRQDFPSEEEQYVTYCKLMDAMKGKPVIVRTLDIGGDKVLSYYQNATEQNPGMGMRSIRFSLKNKHIFMKQIRAILRAGLGADLRIMFPMISSIDEFLEARQVVRDCSDDMKKESIKHNTSPKIGIMVELPSVVCLMEGFAKEADFFSIGTNDFIQFMLGVDRTNENVECFYLPHHPSVLAGIEQVVRIATNHKKDVSICGDIAHDENFIPFLIGIGVRTLSVEPSYVPRMQSTISKVDTGLAKLHAAELLEKTTVRETAELLSL